MKTQQRQELVIAGYTRGRGRREGALGSLVLAVNRGGELVWAGNCGTGFDDAELEMLMGKLEPLRRETSPLAVTPRMPRVRSADVTWVEPELVCEVEFLEWTSDGHLRAPSYKGLRDDKPAPRVKLERPLTLSNLDKVFWPGEGITKGDLIDYYRAVADVAVPHLHGRPFTMKRYPDGIAAKPFFQKNAPSHMPDWIPTAEFPATSREGKGTRMIRYPLVNEEAALLWMANMGCIDLNAWCSRADRADRPDFALFDLDPTPEAGFAAAVEVALLVRQALAAVDLRGYPKTSGSDGVHVLVPLARRYGYDQTRGVVAAIARALAAVRPDLVTTEWSKAKRTGVLIDANQNGPGRTIAFAYSVRPQPGAPVSAPVTWAELEAGVHPGRIHDAGHARPARPPRRPARPGAGRPPGPRPRPALALAARPGTVPHRSPLHFCHHVRPGTVPGRCGAVRVPVCRDGGDGGRAAGCCGPDGGRGRLDGDR